MQSKPLLLCLYISLGMSSALAQTVPVDTTQLFESLWETARLDTLVEPDEEALIQVVRDHVSLPPPLPALAELPPELDQSGRWPLVAQNMAYTGLFYGWMLPYALGVDIEKDFKWYVAGEMLGIGGAFYLTYKYTENMELSHARSQMQRMGSLMGLRAAFQVNRMLEISAYEGLEEDEFTDPYVNEASKTAAWIIMAGIPLGHYLGEILYQRWEPSNGQAWAYTMSTEVGASFGRNLFQILNGDDTPIWDWTNPSDSCYEVPDGYGGFWMECEVTPEYGEFLQAETDWENRLAVPDAIGMTAGLWLGRLYFQDKDYSFGDALMIYQGRGWGLAAGAIVSDLFELDYESPQWRIYPSIGSLAGIWLYDRYLVEGSDYTFGQSALNLLGTSSGALAGLGLSILFEMENSSAQNVLLLAGIGGGQALARKLIPPDAQASSYSDQQASVLITPTWIPGQGGTLNLTMRF